MSNDVLSQFAIADELTNAGLVPVSIVDLNSQTKAVSAQGWVRKLPSIEFGDESSTREWVLDLGQLDMTVGGYLL